ncbi:hypothetical protein GCM10028777_30850 [Angustibacter speluncae]
MALAALLLSGLAATAPASAATTTVVFQRYSATNWEPTLRSQAVARDTVRFTSLAGGGVLLQSSNPYATFRLVPPAGDELAAGRSYGTYGGLTPPPGTAQMILNATRCSLPQGTATVLEVLRAPDGAITSLAVDYTATCTNARTADGVVRWNSAVPFVATSSTTPAQPVALVGEDVTATVMLRNEGSGPQVLGASTLQELVPGGLGTSAIRSDGCAGTTLAPGATCTVGLTLGAPTPLDVRVVLATPDGTGVGTHQQILRVEVLPPPSAPAALVRAARGLVHVQETGAYLLRVERSCAAGPWEVLQASGRDFLDETLTYPTTCAYRTRAVVRDTVSEPSSVVVTGPLPVPSGNEGLFTAVPPARLADTRTSSPRARLGPGEVLSVPVTGRAGVPASGVSAVVLNVTGVSSTAGTWVTAYPGGEAVPATSQLNVEPGHTRANQVVVAVGAGGLVDLRNAVGTVDLVVDVQGYYSTVTGPAGGGYLRQPPSRAYDSRTTGAPAPSTVPVALTAPGWPTYAAAEVVLTVVAPTGAGFATVWSGDGPAPTVSNLNFAPGQTVSARAIVPVRRDASGTSWVSVRTAGGSAHVVVDVVGFYGSSADGQRFRPATQHRLLDTRTAGGGALRDRSDAVVPLRAAGPAVTALVNLTAVGATSNGYLQASSGSPWWAGDQPVTSALTFAPNEVVPVAASTATSMSGMDFTVTNRSTSVHVVVDVVGTFY